MKKPTQIELFPGSSREQVPHTPSSCLKGNLTVSFESIVVLTIAVVIVMIVSFSLGIEKGKRLSQAAERPVREVAVIAPRSTAVPQPEERPQASNYQVANKIEQIVPLSVAVIPEQKTIETSDAQVAVEEVPEKTVDKFYTIQVASFKKRKFAQEEAMALKDKGYDIMVVPKGKYSIVCVGKFSLKEDAKIVSQELKKKYKDCLIRRL